MHIRPVNTVKRRHHSTDHLPPSLPRNPPTQRQCTNQFSLFFSWSPWLALLDTEAGEVLEAGEALEDSEAGEVSEAAGEDSVDGDVEVDTATVEDTEVDTEEVMVDTAKDLSVSFLSLLVLVDTDKVDMVDMDMVDMDTAKAIIRSR
ncbi:uncharacterized protein LOC106075427 [Biomphalaria glabrata]|uniref:Uncharacterized protein LOC106075427 n=1 Tax=Biomphalaria glabrata TaxID=6526 RepID=A0A9W3AX62_BIOGL|nr:uncharacterized protein LOC106075427 [Biomphalaria glabrata]